MANKPNFFGRVISEQEFAQYMRKLMHASIMLNFEVADSNYNQEIQDGYYWLTQFVEDIDPVLQK